MKVDLLMNVIGCIVDLLMNVIGCIVDPLMNAIGCIDGPNSPSRTANTLMQTTTYAGLLDLLPHPICFLLFLW